jgi:hypothetical protein
MLVLKCRALSMLSTLYHSTTELHLQPDGFLELAETFSVVIPELTKVPFCFIPSSFKS